MKTLEDARIAEFTEPAVHVQSQLFGRVRDLRLIGLGQGLILRGHSRTYYGKQFAQQAVMEAAALPVVANGIDVI